MSGAENIAVVRRYFLESHNAPYNLDVMDETCVPAYAEQQKAWHRMEREAFPDKHFEVEDAVAFGDRVVLRWRVRGTHRGAFWTPIGTVPATGKQLELSATITYRLEDGRIAEEWACIDWLDVVRQFGAVVQLPGRQESSRSGES